MNSETMDIHTQVIVHDEAQALLTSHLSKSTPIITISEVEEAPVSDNQGQVLRTFLRGRSQWIHEPVISSWQETDPVLRNRLALVDGLYSAWSQQRAPPFDPFFDPLWLEASCTLRDAGMPWNMNNLNMPEDVDASWPLNSKEFERSTILAKGSRVCDKDDPVDITGYITDYAEGNHFAIRALKQEALRQRPGRQPILLTHNFETDQAQAASRFFNLEWHQIDLSSDLKELLHTISDLTLSGERTIVFAASLGNSLGESDDITTVDQISQSFPLLLHLDASRVFDYLTTTSEKLRQNLELPRLTLHHQNLAMRARCFVRGELRASTITAGGSSAYVYPPPVAVLKPKSLGEQESVKVDYVRGKDVSLSGSRDSIAPLMMYLQEVRFGDQGFREVYQRCAENHSLLVERLRGLGLSFSVNRTTLDLMVDVSCSLTAGRMRKLGAKVVGRQRLLLTVQPSAKHEDFEHLLRLLTFAADHSLAPDKGIWLGSQQLEANAYPVPEPERQNLTRIIQGFKVSSRVSCGYPMNHATYSALGPVIGMFLPVKIPVSWASMESSRILTSRKRTFGLVTAQAEEPFASFFTTGSTMGNRLGLHMALLQHPNAFVYFSSASHYSVKKVVSDCDHMARVAEIPTNEQGSIMTDILIRTIQKHKAECASRGIGYEFIIFANIGTTFTGGRDDLVDIARQLLRIKATPAHIHVDGALNFGFSAEHIQLGPPGGALLTEDGNPIVQGVTLSHHKAYGIMVSGEVLCYCPDVSLRASLIPSGIDSRAIFEMWLFEQAYTAKDLETLWQYCLDNATLLRSLLKRANIKTKYTENSITTVLERPPAWIMKEFQLAPEGDWAHFLTMPHVSPTTIRRFVRDLVDLEDRFKTAFEYVAPSLQNSLGRDTQLCRMTGSSSFAPRVRDIAEGAALLSNPEGRVMLSNLLGLQTAGSSNSLTRFIRDGLSCVIVNGDEIQAVLLAETTPGKLLRPSALLVSRLLSEDEICSICDLTEQFHGHLASLASLNIRRDNFSHKLGIF